MKEKPFSTAKSIIWTETPGSIPLEEIYTKPRVVQKQRKMRSIETVELKDVNQLLGNPSRPDSPPRILTIGKFDYFHR